MKDINWSLVVVGALLGACLGLLFRVAFLLASHPPHTDPNFFHLFVQ